MDPNQVFDEAYARLNKEQQQAVDAIEGPVFVIAGPGTGKTQVLTLRIANILRKTDTPPEAILALTFTDAAAREMRERLTRIIGARAAKVRFHTFHGFAESTIFRFPDQFPRIIGGQIATDAERAEILDQVLLSAPVQHLRPFGDPLYYHYASARAISTMKRENITPEKLEERIKDAWAEFEAADKVHEKGKYVGQMKGVYLDLQKRIQKTEDLLLIYRAYEEALTAAKRYDYEDLILEVVGALESDENFRLQVQEGLHYVLADEHQDANRAQNALLEHVSGFHERPNLFIVGDEKQAIYRFQGADLDNVHHFRSRYADTTVLTLIDNYRSTQTILDTALSLIAASPDERLSRVPLVAAAVQSPKPLTLVRCTDESQEMGTVAHKIEEVLAEGVPPDEVAVLVRRNRDVAEVARALGRLDIATTGAGDEDALSNRFVLALVRLLRAVAEPRDEYLAGVLTLPGFPLTPADTSRITMCARKERRTILSVLVDEEALGAAGVRDLQAGITLGETLEELTRMASFERPGAVAESALQASGLLTRILVAPDRAESLSAVRGLIVALEELSRREHDALLPRALAVIDLYRERGISLSGKGEGVGGKVKVMTVHRAKGREFTEVFIPMLTSRAWSTRARPEHFHLPDVLSGASELEDERRLLYVAITRAKRHATLSYAGTALDGREQEPSELLGDLDTALITEEDPQPAVELPVAPGIEDISREVPSEDDLATLRATFLQQGLSATALNNYLECPWKYFYVNLLRIPEVENKYMLYGTAVHAALKRYADGRLTGTDIGTEGLLRAFNYTLERSPLSRMELDEMHTKGERALTKWWEERHGSWPADARAEVSVQVRLDIEGESLCIRGALDRIDAVSGGVDVIDYKTGRAKSRNELLGNTKDADGNYYRQLTFYRLLLAKADEPLQMRQGILEFVEPDDKGRIRTEAFEITDTDVEELQECIRTTAREIMSLSFWNTPCGEECSWCELRFGVR